MKEITQTSCLRDCLIWPLITSWTSSGTSLPSLLFSLPQRSQPLPCPLTVLPCVWNPLSHVWLLHGASSSLGFQGGISRPPHWRRRPIILASCFSFILFYFPFYWGSTRIKWSTLSIQILSVQFNEFYMCLHSFHTISSSVSIHMIIVIYLICKEKRSDNIPLWHYHGETDTDSWLGV